MKAARLQCRQYPAFKTNIQKETHMQYIAFDAHKHYTWAAVESPQGKQEWEGRIAHERGAIQRFLQFHNIRNFKT
jgi:hypothetical protein